MIFDTLQHCFILNTSVDSVFLKFIIESATTWRTLTNRIALKEMLRGVQQNLFSRTSPDKLPEQNRLQQCIERQKDIVLYLLTLWSAESLTSMKHQQIVMSYLECILHKNNGQIKWLFKWYNGVHEVYFLQHLDWARNQKWFTSYFLTVDNNWITSFCLLTSGITYVLGRWWKWSDGHNQNITMFNCA